MSEQLYPFSVKKSEDQGVAEVLPKGEYPKPRIISRKFETIRKNPQYPNTDPSSPEELPFSDMDLTELVKAMRRTIKLMRLSSEVTPGESSDTTATDTSLSEDN
jgi:hypothetical protein